MSDWLVNDDGVLNIGNENYEIVVEKWASNNTHGLRLKITDRLTYDYHGDHPEVEINFCGKNLAVFLWFLKELLWQMNYTDYPDEPNCRDCPLCGEVR